MNDSGSKFSSVVFTYSCNPFRVLEKTMASVAHSLMIKYGLSGGPSDEYIARWYKQTQALVNRGYSEEEAGQLAASQVFPSYRTRIYASESDTISWLLQQAGDKNNP